MMETTSVAGNKMFRWTVAVVVVVLALAVLALVSMRTRPAAPSKPVVQTPPVKQGTAAIPDGTMNGTVPAPPTPEQIKAQLDALAKSAPAGTSGTNGTGTVPAPPTPEQIKAQLDALAKFTPAR